MTDRVIANFASNQEQNLVLAGIGVLELIHEDVAIARCDGLILLEQFSREKITRLTKLQQSVATGLFSRNDVGRWLAISANSLSKVVVR